MTNITVTSRVGSAPELRYTGTGTPVLNFQLAEDHRAKNPQTGAWESVGTTWRAVSVWARGLMDPGLATYRGALCYTRGVKSARAGMIFP